MEVLRPYVKDVLVGVRNLRSVMFVYVVKQRNPELVLVWLGREMHPDERVKKKDVVRENGVAEEIVLDVTVLTGSKVLIPTGHCMKQRRSWIAGYLLINLLR